MNIFEYPNIQPTLVVTSITLNSNLSNFENNPKNKNKKMSIKKSKHSRNLKKSKKIKIKHRNIAKVPQKTIKLIENKQKNSEDIQKGVELLYFYKI